VVPSLAAWWKLLPTDAGDCDTRWRENCDDDHRAKAEVMLVGSAKFSGIRVTLFLCRNCESVTRAVWEALGGTVYSRDLLTQPNAVRPYQQKEDGDVNYYGEGL